MARLREYYTTEVVPTLKKEFGYNNIMQVPRLEKIVVNIGLGEAIQNVNGTFHDYGPAAGGYKGEKIDRDFQIAERHVDRMHGDASGRSYVRVF